MPVLHRVAPESTSLISNVIVILYASDNFLPTISFCLLAVYLEDLQGHEGRVVMQHPAGHWVCVPRVHGTRLRLDDVLT